MPGRRTNNYGRNILSKHKTIIIFPVENKIKLMFGMLFYNSNKRFVSKPANTFQFVFK